MILDLNRPGQLISSLKSLIQFPLLPSDAINIRVSPLPAADLSLGAESIDSIYGNSAAGSRRRQDLGGVLLLLLPVAVAVAMSLATAGVMRETQMTLPPQTLTHVWHRRRVDMDMESVLNLYLLPQPEVELQMEPKLKQEPRSVAVQWWLSLSMPNAAWCWFMARCGCF